MGRIRLLVGIILALVIPAGALAVGTMDTNIVTLSKGDNRTGTYYAAGQTVTIDGDVSGDVVCAAQTVVINGSVGGDVLCAAQTLTINGSVAGSVRGAGQVVSVNGSVGRNLTMAGQTFTLSSGAKVNGEADVAGQSVVINGAVAQNIYVGAGDLTLDSNVGGNVTSYVQTLALGSGAAVSGNFDYTSDQTFSVPNGKVQGIVTRHTPAQGMHNNGPTASDLIGMLLYWMVASLLGALVAVWLAPRLVRSVTGMMLNRWQSSLGWGLLVLIGAPAVLLALALSVVGLPIMVVLGALWILGIFTSSVFVGVALGKLAWQRDDTNRRALALAAVVGVPAIVLIGWVPFLGALVGFVGAAWTLGGMALAVNRARALG